MKAELVRIRRIDDIRRSFGSRPQYEIEHATPDGQSQVSVTTTPHRVLRDLLGIRHPADLDMWTSAADHAWDGGIGPWTNPSEPNRPTRPTPEANPVVAQRDAQRILSTYRTDTLAGILPLLASTLRATGLDHLAAEVETISEELMIADSAETRANAETELKGLWGVQGFPHPAPTAGSLTERALCDELLRRLVALIQ